MKKIIVMLLMMVLATFASPLFALDESPPGVKAFSLTHSGELAYDKNGLILVDVAHAADSVGLIKVYIWHKDTIHYSWGEGIDHYKIKWIEWQKQNANMNLASTTAAGVTYAKSM